MTENAVEASDLSADRSKMHISDTDVAIEIVGMSPTFAITYLVFFLIVVAVGGLGSIRGAFAAALVLGVIDTAGKYFWPNGGAFFIYLVTIVILLAKPEGLFGKR